MVKVIRATGNSMYLIIENNNQILYDTVFGRIKYGDVLLYKKNKISIAHRCFGRIGSYYIMAGDNCRHFELIHKHDIFGKARVVIKEAQYYKVDMNNAIRIVYTIFLFWFIIINNLTIDSILTIEKDNKIRRNICKKVYKVRSVLQNKYLENCCLKKV